MEILVKPCGEFYTNCYIVDKKIIIDPGVGAFEFVKEHVKEPIAIINTHGHFDHMWDDKKIKELSDKGSWTIKEFFKSNYIASKDVNAWLGIAEVIK